MNKFVQRIYFQSDQNDFLYQFYIRLIKINNQNFGTTKFLIFMNFPKMGSGQPYKPTFNEQADPATQI